VAITAVETIEFLAIATTDGIPVFSQALTWELPSGVKKRIVEALYEQRTEVQDEMPVAEPLLLVLAREADPEVRLEAARYLGALGEVEAIPGLRKRLDGEKDDRVRQTIDWSIRYIRDETAEGPPEFDAKAGT
jgi:HEAT repeat protein